MQDMYYNIQRATVSASKQAGDDWHKVVFYPKMYRKVSLSQSNLEPIRLVITSHEMLSFHYGLYFVGRSEQK